MKRIYLALALCLGLSLAVYLYGHSQYRAGQAYANQQNEQNRKEFEDEANERIAAAQAESRRNQAETARAAGLVAVLTADNRNANARITGLLNAINHAGPKSTGSKIDDRETEWIGLFRSCTARAESLSGRLGELGGEAAELADQVNGLRGYVRAANPILRK